MRLSEAIDQVTEIAFDEVYESDMPDNEAVEIRNGLYNIIEGHVFAWIEEQEEACI